MNTYFVEKAKMTLAGVSIRTTNEAEMGPDGGLSQLWETYFQSNIAGQIATVNPEYIYALYTDYESDASGAYTVVIGHEVAEERHLEGSQLEEGELEENELVESQFTYAAVPESKYMVFKTKKGPVFEVVAQAWGEIWAYFKESGEVRTYTGDFEIYDSRNFDPADTQVEIYIAIE
ncbi:GyrI-like domain-containing protein [Paenibacillus sp. FSL E2-0202]|uniref:GyrI-like domain-containing protein n=1 Tax=unclassified Paenibacillus TaxID=185978 RepID=UPI0030EC68A1